MSHPQPDGRAWQAAVVRRGVVNDSWKCDPTRAEVESCNNALLELNSYHPPTRGIYAIPLHRSVLPYRTWIVSPALLHKLAAKATLALRAEP